MASKRKKNKKEKSTISGTESLTMKSRLSVQSLTPLITMMITFSCKWRNRCCLRLRVWRWQSSTNPWASKTC